MSPNGIVIRAYAISRRLGKFKVDRFIAGRAELCDQSKFIQESNLASSGEETKRGLVIFWPDFFIRVLLCI